MDGMKATIIISIVLIPFLHFKGFIDMNSIYNEVLHNSLFFGSNIGDITGIIFLVINNLFNKIIDKNITYKNTFINYKN